jgi:hypothetical protein
MPDYYGSLTGANTYHSARGNTTWTGADGVKETALLRGSEYIDQAYRQSFPGYKTGLREQLREWPRVDAYDDEGNYIPSDEVPDEVINASYEAALRELVDPGSMLPDYTPGQQERRVKVDVIEVEYTAPHGIQSVLPISSTINGILAPVLTGSVGSSIAGRSERF